MNDFLVRKYRRRNKLAESGSPNPGVSIRKERGEDGLSWPPRCEPSEKCSLPNRSSLVPYQAHKDLFASQSARCPGGFCSEVRITTLESRHHEIGSTRVPRTGEPS